MSDSGIPTPVFECSEFLVLHKPAGMACHGPSDDVTVVDVCERKGWPAFLAHRLDRETSGLLVLAKTAEVAEQFRKLFEAGEVEKYYLALSTKKGRKEQGAIKGFIDKARRGQYKMVANGTREVCTQFFSGSLRPGYRWYVLKPHGGRTHQIRVAMKANGSVILGDELYGADAADRLYLHAFALQFVLGGESYQFQCWPELGEHFQHDLFKQAVEEYGANEPWGLNWPNVS